MQSVVGAGVGREPVLTVDLLAISSELGREVFFLGVLSVVHLRHGLAVSFNNLKILVVDPDAALEIALPRLNLAGCYIEDVGPELILSLLPDIQNLVPVD